MPELVSDDDPTGRIADLLRELSDLIGPTPGDVYDEDDPTGEVLLNEWVLVASWIDEDGNTFISMAHPPGMPAHHRVGLLYSVIDW